MKGNLNVCENKQDANIQRVFDKVWKFIKIISNGKCRNC